MSGDREWVRSALQHEEQDAIPYNFSVTPPAQRKLEAYYGTDDFEKTLGFPIRMTGPKTIKPLYADPARFGATLVDEFGVTWTTSTLDRGVPVGPPLLEPDLRGYRFPDPTADYRFEDLGAWCQKNRDHFTIIWVGDLWERATFMRGMENLLIDVALQPTFVEELLTRIAQYIIETLEILFERFSFDGIAVSDDYGTQSALMMSPDAWRALIKPRLADIYGLARKHARTVFHHTCGHVHPIAGDMIEVGLDILHPIQPEANDIYALKREFGRHVTLCGGIRTQDLMSRGSPDDIRTEIRQLKSGMGRGGGYILEPGITLQDDVPIENLVAMVEAMRTPASA